MNDDLRQQADELEARLAAGRDRRHKARLHLVGRLFTSGSLWLPTSEIVFAREGLERGGEESAEDAHLLSLEVLAAHGYDVRGAGDEEEMTGPTCWPRGALPRLGSALVIAPSATPADGGGGPPARISRVEARRQVQVCRAYADWHDAIADHDTWQRSQARRAWLIGNWCGPLAIKHSRWKLQRLVLVDGEEGEADLWADAEMDADYSDGVPGA